MTREEASKEIEFQMQCAEDEGRYSLVKVYKYVLEALSEPTKTDNMTNGDVIKAMFPDAEIDEFRGSDGYGILHHREDRYNVYDTSFSAEWFNASYKGNFTMPTKTEPKWMSVDERLPENFQRVLVTIVNYNGNKVVRVAEYYGRQRIFQIKENHEQWEVGEKGLLAWRPLPEPYKAESETEQGLSYADQDTLMSAT